MCAMDAICINLGICIAPTQPFRVALALKAECVTRVTRQTGKLNEHLHTTTSRSQQLIKMESKSTATAGIQICDLRDASSPL
jgi:hypothetical protein